MQITINTPNGEPRTIEISNDLEAHWKVPINHSQTILDQINSGMYDRFFKGKKDLVCMDFGANVGLVSLYMLPACKELHCIEPTPKHFTLLEQLLSDKDVKAIFLRPYALAEKEGEVVFMTGHSTENKITSTDGYGNGKINVKAFPLSWYVQDKEIDFCKIDVEGYENNALTEGEILKVRGKVKTFFVELHPGYGLGFAEIERELTRKFSHAGYIVEMLDHQTLVAEW